METEWKIIIGILVISWVWFIWELITAPTYPDDWEN